MDNRYTEEGARAYVERHRRAGEDLALRVYTSHLLGAESALVLHGGGNTSVKSKARESTGESVDVLYVKGSGWDLGDIAPAGFPACRLERLRRSCELERLSDEQMVAELRGQMLDPSSPTPSVEALLHALVPAKYVDHTHADAVLAIVDRPEPGPIVAELWGSRALLLPYVMPGFALARAVRAIADRLLSIEILVLDKHGIFTWGATAKESYDRMIAAVSDAERWLAADRGAPVEAPRASSEARRRALARIAPVLRGAVARTDAASDRRMVVLATEHPDVVALGASRQAIEAAALGTVTPDHVLRTRPFPLVLDGEPTREGIDAAVRAWGERYDAWVDRGIAARQASIVRLDRLPRVVIVPGTGALALGATIADASIVRDVLEHASHVILDVLATAPYRPVSELDLFDVEYWSLEQAKLGRTATAPLAMSRRIALVTGAASGIGRATAEQMLAAGGHAMLVDRDAERLFATADELAKRFGPRVRAFVADLTDAEQARASVAACVAELGGLDVLVSNAGNAPQGLLHEADGERALERSLELNLMAHQRVARAAVEVMLAQGIGGCLLFNASKSAFNQGPRFGPYAVAKAALVALMRQYAIDLGASGIRANAVNADRIRTELFGGGVLEARAKARGVSVDDYFRANLLGRETTADDVARAFVHLATAEATTGCVVTVDGGNAAAFPR